MNYTSDNDSVYHQTQNPVTPPPGFAQPTFAIGDRVKVVFTVLSPLKGKYEGYTGTISNIIFCKSDGKTILYGVAFDPQYHKEARGIRCESFELDKLEDQAAPVETFSDEDLGLLKAACQTVIVISRQEGHAEQIKLYRALVDKLERIQQLR